MSASTPDALSTAVSSVAVGLLMALPVRDHLHDRSKNSWGDFESFGSSTAREFSFDEQGPGSLAA